MNFDEQALKNELGKAWSPDRVYAVVEPNGRGRLERAGHKLVKGVDVGEPDSVDFLVYDVGEKPKPPPPPPPPVAPPPPKPKPVVAKPAPAKSSPAKPPAPHKPMRSFGSLRPGKKSGGKGKK